MPADPPAASRQPTGVTADPTATRRVPTASTTAPRDPAGTAADPRAVLSRPAPAADATVRYGGDRDQVADLRFPAPRAGPPLPLVIVVHGGFWRDEYDRGHTGPLAADLAARGYPVAQLEYRRTGRAGGGWPGTFDDVAAGVSALPALAATALPAGTVAPGAPILLGHSAGGHLALWCAARALAEPRGVLALAPVVDLAEAYRLDLDGGAVADLLGGGPDEVPERYAFADPGRTVPSPTRTVIVHGALDRQVPARMSERYAADARQNGADIRLIRLPNCEHYGLIDPESAAWTTVTTALQSLHG